MPLMLLIMLTCMACQSDDPSPASGPAAVVDNDQVENRGAGKDDWWNALPRPEWSAFERIDVAGHWFEVYRVRDRVYAIYEPGQFEEVISFLIEGDERALLFDTGLGIGDIGAVVDELTDLDVAVLNSHTHYDHIGGNYQFDSIYGRDTGYTKARAAGTDTATVAEFLSPGWVWKDLPEGFDADTYRIRPFDISTIVGEGDTIDLGGRTLEVLLTPGHAPDALCLIDRGNRLLFVGDTFYLAPLYTHIEGSDYSAYADTAARLAALAADVDTVMTAHNVPVVSSDYLAELDAAFDTIAAGSGDYVQTDGNREYDFGDFSVIVREGEIEN